MNLINSLRDDRRAVVIFQDDEALQLMRECEFLERLPKPPDAPGPWYAAGSHKGLPGHYVIGAVISGLADAAENGAVAYVLCKRRHSEGDVLRLFEELARGVGADPGRMRWL